MKSFLFKAIIFFWKICPFKIGLSRLIRKNEWLKGKLYRDLRYKGEMKFADGDKQFKIYNPGNSTLENELFWNGMDGWEKVSVNIWIKLSRNCHGILDIGANSGYFSMLAAFYNKVSPIFSFEPVERTRELFNKNKNLNSFDNIMLYDVAVSDKNGEASFYDVGSETQYSASLSVDMFDAPNKIEYKVKTIRLDDFEPLNDIKIELVKVDVETFEPQVLKGMIGLIESQRPIFLIEILNERIGEEIYNILNPLTYRFLEIDEISGLMNVQKLGKGENQNYLAFPENRLDYINSVLDIKLNN